MKKIVLILGIITTTFFSLYATDTDVDSKTQSDCNYSIYSKDVKVRSDNQFELKICVRNESAITLWQTDLTLPQGISIATDSFGDLDVRVSGDRTNSNRHSLSLNKLQGNTYRLLCASNNNNNFLGNDGEVATLVLNVDKDVVDGIYSVLYNNSLFVEDNEVGHNSGFSFGHILVDNSVLGDLNRDGKVDVDDMNAIINIILDN